MEAKKNRLVLLSVVIVILGAILVAACSRQADTSPVARGASPGPPPSSVPASPVAPSLAVPVAPPISNNPVSPVKTASAAPDNPVRSNSGGSVDFKVTLMDKTQALVFNVAMDTHSVDLDSYDLKTLSVLRDGQKNEFAPVSWDAPPGGHHRSGTLTFDFPESLQQGQAITLIIRDVSGVPERVFEWAL